MCMHWTVCLSPTWLTDVPRWSAIDWVKDKRRDLLSFCLFYVLLVQVRRCNSFWKVKLQLRWMKFCMDTSYVRTCLLRTSRSRRASTVVSWREPCARMPSVAQFHILKPNRYCTIWLTHWHRRKTNEGLRLVCRWFLHLCKTHLLLSKSVRYKW